MQKIIRIQGEKKGKEFVIDLKDKLQRRYEMVRELKLSKDKKEDICRKFNYTRATGHIYEVAWDKERWEGLKDKKKGPKIKYRREPVEDKVLSYRFRNPNLDMYDISDLLKEKGYKVSPVTISRILSSHGVTLKKMKSMKR